MKTAFYTNNDFTYFAEVKKIELLENAYNIKITSQWLSAKNPNDEQTQFQTTCAKEDLQRLSSLIEQVITNG